MALAVHPAAFPTQLNQLLLAVQHFISSGVPPARIFLAGNSAGGNLVLQLISHILHPSPLSPLPSGLTGLCGACLISPWVMLDTVLPSELMNDATDFAPARSIRAWQEAYLAALPAAHRAYVEAGSAPSEWFTGLGQVVRCILVTAGRNEVLYDSIRHRAQTLEAAHGHIRLDVQDGGVHCDPMFDISAKSTVPHLVEERIIEWLAEFLGDEH
jgi:acetyl esterase/lipase